MGGLCFARHLLQHPLYNPQLRNARWNLIADIKDDWIILTAYQYHEWVDNMTKIPTPTVHNKMMLSMPPLYSPRLFPLSCFLCPRASLYVAVIVILEHYDELPLCEASAKVGLGTMVLNWVLKLTWCNLPLNQSFQFPMGMASNSHNGDLTASMLSTYGQPQEWRERDDNRSTNLEWTTYKYNARHGNDKTTAVGILSTGDVLLFMSITEVMEFFLLDSINRDKLNKEKAIIVNGIYQDLLEELLVMLILENVEE